jgi:serine/threonine protein kinase/WD40 repeat protein
MQEQSIFSAALEKEDPAERAAFLDQACAGDPALRQRIERLLERHRQPDSFLEAPAAVPAATVDDPITERPGTVIGPYKLLQQIGEGGMGAVFMAEQTEPVQRKVALKIIKPGMDSRHVIARFEAERQALALMDHPNIARVLDAGTTTTGRPYFVMELVKGLPITRYCDERHLTPRQRLELFIPVCQAVQHAHQKGVIHRDLKPSNVLVALYDGNPVPKVIDFGVAKATGPRLTERTLFTEFGQVVGTLEYMSPEQAELNQLDIDTRSDIYSLGVLLYELLTGTTPLERKRLKAGAMLEMLRLIREEEPPKPSTRLSTTEDLPSVAANRGLEPKKLRGLVRGELDWIVMKALEKDRQRRYETANGLALDVQRYLHDEPVEACPPSVGYRLRKFTRKHRALLTTAAAFAALLLLATVVSTWLAVEAMRAEAVAKEERDAADGARGEASDERTRADQEAAQAKTNAAETRRALDRLTVARGIQLAEEGNLFAALPWFVRPLERGGLTPEEEQVHRTRIACYLKHTPGRPTLRHVLFCDGPVQHGAWSADAKRVLTASKAVVQVWDTASGEPVATLPHSGYVTAAQFTPDGKRVVTVAGSAVWTWEAGSGRLLGSPLTGGSETFPQQPLLVLPQTPLQLLANLDAQGRADEFWRYGDGSFSRLEISRDGRRAMFCYKHVLRLLDIEAQKPIQQWLVDESGAWDSNFALGPDGRWVLFIKDGVASAHDIGTGKSVPLSVQEDGPTASVTLSQDGTRALTIGKDGAARVWDATTWQPRARLGDLASRHSDLAEFSPDNRGIAFWGGWLGGIRSLSWWDAESGKLVREFPDNDNDLLGFDWRADGQQLLRVSKRGEVALWDASSGTSAAFVLTRGRGVTTAGYGPDARQLLTAGEEGEVCLWDFARPKEPFPAEPPGSESAGASLRAFVVAGRGHYIGSMVRITTTRKVNGEEKVVTSPVGDERKVVTTPDLDPIRRRLPPGTDFDNAAISPDQGRVITGHRDPQRHSVFNMTSLQLWDVSTGRRLGQPLQSSAGFSYAVFSPDNRWLAATSMDGTVSLVDARTGEPAGRPLQHEGAVYGAAFSPDDTSVVTCGEDKTARLWRTATGEPVGEPLGHQDPVTLAAFSPDGQTITTASLDGAVRLWDAHGNPLGVLQCKEGHAWGMRFDPKTSLLVVDYWGPVRVWDVASQQQVGPAVEGSFAALLLPSDDRPVGDLVKLGQLYAGQHLDVKGGTVALRKDERQALWRELRARYPGEFAVSAEAALAWRVGQLGSASKAERPAAIAFGRRWLAAELADSGWQPGERGNEELAVDDYLQRLSALAQHGRPAEAVAAADALAVRWAKDADTLYGCACVHALAAGAVKDDAALAERHAARAVALLSQAVAAGFKDGEQLRKDPDLDALRQRKDFLQLQRDLDGAH